MSAEQIVALLVIIAVFVGLIAYRTRADRRRGGRGAPEGRS